MEAQQTNRALFEAIEDKLLQNDEISASYDELVGVMSELVSRAQLAGAIRGDVGALDLIVMTKGICEAASALQHVNPDQAERQLGLVRAVPSTDPVAQPLQGRAPDRRGHAARVPPCRARASARAGLVRRRLVRRSQYQRPDASGLGRIDPPRDQPPIRGEQRRRRHDAGADPRLEVTLHPCHDLVAATVGVEAVEIEL